MKADDLPSSDWKCAAYGCPLPGALSSDRNPSRWYCRFHFTASAACNDAITLRIQQHLDRIDELFRLRRDPAVSSRYLNPNPDESRHEYLTRCDRAIVKLVFGADVMREAA